MIPDSEDIGELFIEYRIPDRQGIPSITTSWNFLFKALVMKAWTLSQQGILTFTDAEWQYKKDMIAKCFNQSCEKLESDLTLKESTRDFLEFLEPEFEYIDGQKAFKILNYLVDNPLWQKKNQVLTKEEIDSLEKLSFKDDFRVNPELYLRHIVLGEPEKVEILIPDETSDLIKDELILGVSQDKDLADYLSQELGINKVLIQEKLKEFEPNIIKTKKCYRLNG